MEEVRKLVKDVANKQQKQVAVVIDVDDQTPKHAVKVVKGAASRFDTPV